MTTSIHKAAVAAGADLAPAYHFNGLDGPATYTVTLAQLEVIAIQAVTGHTKRILTALDAMTRGCVGAGFRGLQNGGGESVGDELQEARDELAVLVGHDAAVTRSTKNKCG